MTAPLTRREALEQHAGFTVVTREDPAESEGRMSLGRSQFASVVGLPSGALDVPVLVEPGVALADRAWHTVQQLRAATSQVIASTLPEHIEHRGIPGRASLSSLFAAMDNLRGYRPEQRLAELLAKGAVDAAPDVPLQLCMSRETMNDFREAMRREPAIHHPSAWKDELTEIVGAPIVDAALPRGTWRLEVAS